MKFVCGCGLENHTLEDWLAHWKYGMPYNRSYLTKYPKVNEVLSKHPKVRAVWLFLMTKVTWK